MRINVKPKDGLTVPHPETGSPMKAGSVEKTPAIIRLIWDGDLIETATPVKKAPAKKKTSQENKS
jgi:hypothetical protein